MIKYKTPACDACQVLVINNHVCHELGCPETWKTEIRRCRCCGDSFQPENRYQRYCCDDCADTTKN